MEKTLCITETTKGDILIADILIHVLILGFILSAFFLLVIEPLSASAWKKEVENAIKSEICNVCPQSVIKSLKRNLPCVNTNCTNKTYGDLLKEYYKTDEGSINISNKSLILVLTIVLSGIFLFLLFYVLTLTNSCRKSIPIGKLLVENLFLFVLIGIFEALFFFYVAKKYIPVKPSYLTTSIIKNLNSIFAQPSSGGEIFKN